jgi:hypothetical protein
VLNICIETSVAYNFTLQGRGLRGTNVGCAMMSRAIHTDIPVIDYSNNSYGNMPLRHYVPAYVDYIEYNARPHSLQPISYSIMS